jgi:hypothetical protein
MRRINVKARTLSSIPADAYVELLRDSNTGISDSKPQYAPVNALQASNVTVVATAGGGTTGLIPANASYVSITSSVATKAVSLPAAIAGKEIRLFCAANGCEVVSAVAGDKLNTVVIGATNEAPLTALTLYTLVYDGVDNWVCTGADADGAVEAPIVPNSL